MLLSFKKKISFSPLPLIDIEFLLPFNSLRYQHVLKITNSFFKQGESLPNQTASSPTLAHRSPFFFSILVLQTIPRSSISSSTSTRSISTFKPLRMSATPSTLQSKTGIRKEADTFGPLEVPADRYWGAQTQRLVPNTSWLALTALI